MDCKRAQELIAPFINGQLNTEETEAFLEHMETCKECREELEVSYSLMTAMKQLDEGTDLSDNYIADLNHKIEECYMEGLRRKRSCARRRALLLVLLLLLVLMNGITVVNKREEADLRFFRKIAGMEPVQTEQFMQEETIPAGSVQKPFDAGTKELAQ
ncbi:MAG: anti-sigma factor family protein [Lachnospiraceae bacterium]